MNNNQTPPDKPGNSSGAPSATASNTSHAGATTISEATTASSQAYTSATGGENALLVTGGESTLTDAEITKTGDESSENSDFYGTNAAVLATGGSLTLDGVIGSKRSSQPKPKGPRRRKCRSTHQFRVFFHSSHRCMTIDYIII